MIEEPEAAPGPGIATRLYSILVVVMGAVALAGVLWWAATSQMEPPSLPDWTPPRAARVVSEESQRYVGPASCRDCHPGECAAFSRSGHARTLRPAASDPIASWLDGQTVADPERPSVTWFYHLQDGKLTVDRRERDKTETFPLEYRLGSGQVGITFVTTMKSGPEALPVGLEHRLSYIAVGRKLDITTGQQEGGVHGLGTKIVPHGRLLDEPRLLRCLSCHVTTTSKQDSNRLDTATMIPNVTCERCHGPGGAHVQAARRGGDEIELRMRLGLENASPSAQITACGECHRSPEQVDLAEIRPDDLAIVRFQPIGLAKSKCFQGGASWLSCTSCHDPHARVSRDTAAYEAVCLRCHQPAGEAKRLCPVSPTKECLGCHMPRRAITAEFLFTDHWIRVRSEDRKELPRH